MSNHYTYKPTHKGYVSVDDNCDFCGIKIWESKAAHAKKKRHFCSRQCYSDFRRDLLPKEEHARFGSGYSLEEKQKRVKARSILNHYLRDNKITRPTCEVCGLKAEAHHHDYDKPLDVKWLCFKHHRELHKKDYQNPQLIPMSGAEGSL